MDLTVYDNKLIAGGSFITAGDIEARYIAAWDGSTWSAMGSGMNGSVIALAVCDDKLVAGGAFRTAGGDTVNDIAAWDGTTWSPLGSGISKYSAVGALTVYDSKLIAGGSFTTTGVDTLNRIAAWDGATWSPLGTGMNAGVDALAVYDNKLIAGGSFTTAGGVGANYIAAWDGSSWSSLGSGMEYGPDPPYTSVRALTVYDNMLIAGGEFTTAGGVDVNYIAAWDGSAWSSLDLGVACGPNRPEVDALIVYDNKLIAVGEFWAAGGVEAYAIAAWDGSTWSPLGSGMNWIVGALGVFDNSLMVGGDFIRAGDKVSGYIAQWTKYTSDATLLQSFVASHRGSAIEIEWSLSEQVPNESFVIERAGKAVECGGSPGEFVELHGAEVTENALHYGFSDADITPGMTYRYRVGITSEDGSRDVLFETEAITIPSLSLTLFQNHPNPFNPSTMIRYYLPEDTDVTLGVYDASGRLVVRFSEREKQPSGYHEFEWNGRDASGKAVASGVYFCRLQAGKLTQSRKMIVLR